MLKLDITYLQLLSLFLLSFPSLLPPYISPSFHSLSLSLFLSKANLYERVRESNKMALYISHRIYFQNDHKNVCVCNYVMHTKTMGGEERL